MDKITKKTLKLQQTHLIKAKVKTLISQIFCKVKHVTVENYLTAVGSFVVAC